MSRLAEHSYGDMIKAVVDIEKGIMAVGGTMHADMIPMLRAKGSISKDLWGIKLFPGTPNMDRLIEFNSLINVKEGNPDEDIVVPEIKQKIIKIVENLINF